MKRNILITGGAGFIGSHLVDRLLAGGDWRITVIDDLDDFYAPGSKRANIAGDLTPRHWRRCLLMPSLTLSCTLRPVRV